MTTRHAPITRPGAGSLTWRGLFLAGFCGADLLLLIMVVHDQLSFEEPWWEFLKAGFDTTTLLIGKVVLLVSIAVGLYTGTLPSTEALVKPPLRALSRITEQKLIFAATAVALTVAAMLLGHRYFSGVRFYPAVLQDSSAVLITPDGSEVYIADAVHRSVCWLELETPDARLECIAIPGQPEKLAYVPQADQVLVSDVESNSIVVIRRREHKIVDTISDLPSRPRSIIVTTDGRKAYVSMDQIAVIDLLATPHRRLRETAISVPSPEGMAIRGRRLYVAGEPTADRDAVFVIDTATDRILERLPGFGGYRVGIAGESGQTLYVTRGDSLAALHISRGKLQPGHSLPLKTGSLASLAVTEDGRTALVADAKRITAIDAVRDEIRLFSVLPNAVTGVAISRNRAYAWIGTECTFDIRSLLPGAHPESVERAQ